MRGDMWKLHFLQHALDTIYTTPTYIDSCKFSATFSIQASAPMLAAGGGGKGRRVWWRNETPQPSPVCMWAVSCIVSRPYATHPALVPSCPSSIQKSVCASSSQYREAYFTSLEIQLLIGSVKGTINSRDRKTNAFFRFLCTYWAAAVCPISIVPAVTACTVFYGCEIWSACLPPCQRTISRGEYVFGSGTNDTFTEGW